MLDTYPKLLETYGRKQRVITIVSPGGNNSRAVDRPDNFVSTPEAFQKEMRQLLRMLKEQSDTVIVVGSGYIDESRTTPKKNPLTGGLSYFTNDRRNMFTAVAKQACVEFDVNFVSVDMSEEEWLRTCLYKDGLHPNQAGHRAIFESIRPLLENSLR